MEKILSIIIGIVSLLSGIFFSLYSKRLSIVLIKSSNMLGEVLNIKKELSKGMEIFAQVFLIAFGIASILIGIRLIIQIFK